MKESWGSSHQLIITHWDQKAMDNKEGLEMWMHKPLSRSVSMETRKIWDSVPLLFNNFLASGKKKSSSIKLISFLPPSLVTKINPLNFIAPFSSVSQDNSVDTLCALYQSKHWRHWKGIRIGWSSHWNPKSKNCLSRCMKETLALCYR